MTTQRAEIVIDADGLLRTEQKFKTLDKYLERLQNQIDKIGRMRAAPIIGLIDRATPKLEKIQEMFNRMAGQSLEIFGSSVAVSEANSKLDVSDRLPGLKKIEDGFRTVMGVIGNGPKELLSLDFVKNGSKILSGILRVVKDDITKIPKKGSELFNLLRPENLKGMRSTPVQENVPSKDERSNFKFRSKWDSDWVDALTKKNNEFDKLWTMNGYGLYSVGASKELRDWINTKKGIVPDVTDVPKYEKLFKYGYKLLEKLFRPVDAVVSGVDIATTESAQERRGKIGEYIGSLIFSIVGEAIGTALLPVGGTALGGIAGYEYGAKVGREYAEDPIKAFGKTESALPLIAFSLPYMFFNKDKDKLGKTDFFMLSLLMGYMEKKKEEADFRKKIRQQVRDSFSEGERFNIAPGADGYLSTGQVVRYSKDPKNSTTSSSSSSLLVPSSSENSTINVNLPVGAVQLTIQGTEINYDELSMNVGNRFALAVKQAMTNKSAVLV